jgi:sugar-specific transcriptional regulator TrmB
MELQALIPELRKLGLTLYEAKCYVHLSRLGQSDPRRVASEAGIPYPNAYESLRRLVNRGWVEVVRKHPAVYRARRPSTVKGQVISEISDAFETLDKLYSSIPAEDAELVYTLRDRKKVISKVLELLREAKKHVIVVGPSGSFSQREISEAVLETVQRGVRLRVVSDEAASIFIPEGADMRVGNLLAVDLLVDGRIALISLPDFSACGWSDSPAVVGHFLQFLELMWETSKAKSRQVAPRP